MLWIFEVYVLFSIFIWFLNEFLSIFIINITKKGIYLQVMTWWAGPDGELTWHVGPPRGCDAALRPRGRAASGPHEAQAAHKARTRGRRPRMSTQVHANTRVGRHVAMGVNIWRAHGLVGPAKKFGAVTQMRYRAPIFKLESFGHFFHVGLCSHTVLTFFRWRGGTTDVGSTGIAWNVSMRWT